MKLKDLIPKLQALNPEAEVMQSGDAFVERIVFWDWENPEPGVTIKPGVRDATPSDTLIVLSE